MKKNGLSFAHLFKVPASAGDPHGAGASAPGVHPPFDFYGGGPARASLGGLAGEAAVVAIVQSGAIKAALQTARDATPRGARHAAPEAGAGLASERAPPAASTIRWNPRTGWWLRKLERAWDDVGDWRQKYAILQRGRRGVEADVREPAETDLRVVERPPPRSCC